MRLISTLACCALALRPTALGQDSLPARELADSTSEARVASPRNAALPDGLSSDDWSRLRSAYEAGRHAAHEVDGGHQAHNPGQRWGTRFDGRGFTTRPDIGGWSWGLQLESYGFEGNTVDVSGRARADAAGGRITYAWNDDLEEWYVNDTRGLEHGYTLHRRPARRDGVDAQDALNFHLSVRGDLAAEVHDGGLGVSFVDRRGATVLTYSGLTVFDADGRRLPARIDRVGAQLRLSIAEHGARYPLTIDPIAQQAYLKASNTDDRDEFGTAVAVSGDTVVIGAHLEDGGSSGVNGNQNNGATDAGAAYVFVRTGHSWTQQAYLKASNTNLDDRFGLSVAVSGNTIVVGAYQEDSNATAVNGVQNNNSAVDAGAAYVFVRNGTTWSQQAYLKASNTDAMDRFGYAVAVSGDTVVVGARGEDSNATGVNGEQGDNSASASGAAYVFVRNGTTWTQEAYLKASNAEASDLFGRSVSISGDTLVVGATQEASNATGVNGDQSDNSLFLAGAAYVFVRSGTTWSQEAYLKASNPGGGDYFAFDVSVSGDIVVVGAPEEASNATGVNGDQSDNSLSRAGAAYVFARSGATWTQEAYLKAPNTDSIQDFGFTVSASNDRVLVGAKGDSSGATGVNGDWNNQDILYSGAAHLFLRNGTTWSQEAYLKASNTGFGDLFAHAVAISGDTVVVGAPRERSNATGVNGDQSDNSLIFPGAAYVFDLNTPLPGFSYCFGDGSGNACPCAANGNAGEGCANTGGVGGATLGASGYAEFLDDSFQLEVSGIPGAKAGIAVKGSTQLGGGNGNLVGDGLLCTAPQLRSQVIVSSANGTVTMGNWRGQPFSAFSGAANLGTPTYYQWWYRDPGNTCSGQGFNFTNGWCVTWTL